MENNVKRRSKQRHHKYFKTVPAGLAMIKNKTKPQIQVISIHRNYYK